MQRIAVFARNHAKYLVSACTLSKKDPIRLITFRSAVKWSKAKKALDAQRIVQVYLASNGSKGLIEYEATLKALVLKPSQSDPETIKALAQGLPETSNEGLWGTDSRAVKTLYIISHCHRLASPLSISQLRKVSDNMPISEKYGYSYVPVFEVEETAPTELNPEEIKQPSHYYEGATKKVAVNAYERNASARKHCVAHFGTCCAVCQFNFGAKYGAIGQDFIHVHHLKPLAKVKETYQVNPIEDLRPVCPNCHSMLHMRTPPYSVEELTAIINGKG
jgi:hypothetical protein